MKISKILVPSVFVFLFLFCIAAIYFNVRAASYQVTDTAYPPVVIVLNAGQKLVSAGVVGGAGAAANPWITTREMRTDEYAETYIIKSDSISWKIVIKEKEKF